MASRQFVRLSPSPALPMIIASRCAESEQGIIADLVTSSFSREPLRHGLLMSDRGRILLSFAVVAQMRLKASEASA